MAWHCQINGKEVGPVGPEEWSRLVSSGRITGSTWVRKDGMAGWRRLSGFGEVGVPTTPPEHRVHLCVECGLLYPDEELARFGAARVCGGCKASYVERLLECAPPAGRTPHTGVHAADRRLVVKHGARPPQRCVLCNEPAKWSRRQAYHWHPPWILLSMLATPAAFLVVAMICNRTLEMDLHLCEVHARKRRRRIVLAGVWGTAGVLIMAAAVIGHVRGLSPVAVFWLLVLGIISAFTAPLYAQRALRVLLPRRINGHGAVLNGASPDFLASLPPWTGDPV